jgi:hypothetical protein
VPVEFLSDEQAAGFGRFAGELSRADLERFFYLDDADRDLIAVRRGDHNRLGFAVQLGTVRFLGAFLADSLDVPWGVVEFLAAQLDIADSLVVKRYTLRVSTVHEHAREIRVAYGYLDLDGPLTEELTLFVYSRAWTHGEGLTVLFEHAAAWLHRQRVRLPGVSVLARLVAGFATRPLFNYTTPSGRQPVPPIRACQWPSAVCSPLTTVSGRVIWSRCGRRPRDYPGRGSIRR